MPITIEKLEYRKVNATKFFFFFLFENQITDGVFYVGRGQHDLEGKKFTLHLSRFTLFCVKLFTLNE